MQKHYDKQFLFSINLAYKIVNELYEISKYNFQKKIKI